MTPADHKALLFAHFANKTTPLQCRMIDEWLKDEANQERYYAWLVEWENQLPIYQPELETPLARFENHMKTHSVEGVQEPAAEVTEISIETASRANFGWMAAAAVFVLLALGGWLNRSRLFYQTYQTAYGETRTIRLTDGSTVTLNAHSSLRVPRFGFGIRSREVDLSGEAFFAMQHRADDQKFIVQTPNGFNVIVHGTEFNVSARTHRANVMLHKGSIQMDYALGNTRQQLMLKPGDVVTMNRHSHPQLRHHVWTQPYLAWKDHRFIFDHMTLTDFGQLVTDTYGLRVEIASPTLARRTLVGSLQATSVDELLQTVSELFDLSVVRQANSVILKEKE
ncbi:FecR domain-containing protein [Spirosoma sp. BT702]|uniref:FecR domain-containing protein n=1 Tax=Spirosoma profusum TaxID=2771354 RepID=A0A927ARD8_9BACT|nr:FecR domain-containing protein [Spirosoma profusum]MBD2699585.1 FecR domain-containing protein [Spirosoma profusum]